MAASRGVYKLGVVYALLGAFLVGYGLGHAGVAEKPACVRHRRLPRSLDVVGVEREAVEALQRLTGADKIVTDDVERAMLDRAKTSVIDAAVARRRQANQERLDAAASPS